MIAFSLSPEAAAITRPGMLACDGVRVVEREPAMDDGIAATEHAMRGEPDPGQIVAAVRAMYRQFGIDPTKTRPSSEALLRRIMKGEPLPRVNSVVDVGNWCSLETQLPYGLYDLAKIDGAIELRLGREGEEYAGIRKDVVHVTGRLVLCDAKGPFGNPTSDSARTMVTSATEAVLVAIIAPAGLPSTVVEHALALTDARLARFTGARRLSGWTPGVEA